MKSRVLAWLLAVTVLSAACAGGSPPSAPAASGGSAPASSGGSTAPAGGAAAPPSSSSSAPASSAATTPASRCDLSAKPQPSSAFKPFPKPEASVIEAAKKEGKVVWYSSYDDNVVSAIKAAFEKEYPGITVAITEGLSATYQSKFMASADAGNQEADVINANWGPFFTTAASKSYILPMDKVITGFSAGWPKAQLADLGNGGATGMLLWKANGFAYNTQLMPAALTPNTWKDLTKPEFKGKILSPDPNASISFAQHYQFLLNLLGEEGFKALGENVIKTPLYPSQAPAAQALAAGAGWITITLSENIAQDLISKDAPIKWILPEDATGPQNAFAVADKSPNPNAAKVFANWLFSENGQWYVACTNTGATVAFPDTFMKVPRYVPASLDAQKDLPKILELGGFKKS